MKADMTMTELAEKIHENAREKGFYEHEGVEVPEGAPLGDRFYVENPSLIPEKLALIHSEVSEALEAWREDKAIALEEELADVIIRTLDLAAFMGSDIEQVVLDKMEKNLARPYKHGKVNG